MLDKLEKFLVYDNVFFKWWRRRWEKFFNQ